jgi:hypothetical protein
MKSLVGLVSLLLLSLSIGSLASGPTHPPSNGIAYSEGRQDWATIAISHRTDNNTMRVILGKVVWKAWTLEHWPKAVAPGDLVHAEFMFKDSSRYADSIGWGWARWTGLDQKPFDDGMQACIACHTPVKSRDWVFTEPAPLPR